MRKRFVSGLVIASIFLIAGCKSNNEKEISSRITNSSTSNVENNLDLAEKEYDSLVGTWECIDSDCSGEKVSIMRSDGGMSFLYEGEDEVETECVSRSQEKEDIFFNFENIDSEMMYMVNLKPNGNIILNQGTVKSQTTGLSKPMEYKKISE